MNVNVCCVLSVRLDWLLTVFLLHRAHPNSAPSVLFAQHLAAVFVFVVSHLPVPNSDHHDHQKDKFLVDIMVLHAS